jgi:hypothetical protein
VVSCEKRFDGNGILRNVVLDSPCFPRRADCAKEVLRCCRSLGLATGLFAGGVPKISAWKIILQGITELRDGWLTRDLEPNVFFHAAHTIIACGKRWKVLASSENILGTLP